MTELQRSLFEVMALSTVITVVDFIISIVIVLIVPSEPFFSTVSNLLIFEFGIMLVFGACMMSRQPLDDEKRYDDEGEPVSSWRWALIGRKTLASSAFVIVLAVLFALI